MSEPQAFTADPDQLRAHASRLAAHADQLSSMGAALPGQLGGQSLGMFAQFITAGLGAAMTGTASAFAHASSTVDKVGDGMRRAAEGYQNTEDGHAARVTALGTELGEDVR